MGFRAPALVLLIVLTLALGACGDGDKEAAPTTGDTTTAVESVPTTTSEPTTSTEPETTTGSVTPPPAGTGAAKAVAAYRAYLAKYAGALVKQTTVFSRALVNGDPERAVKTYPGVRAAYERLQRVAVRLDLDTAMNAQEGAVPAGEWSGLHRIEKTIFESGGTSGTEGDATSVLEDTGEIRNAIAALELDPQFILDDAKALLQRIAEVTNTPEAEPYSKANLNAISGNLRTAEAAWKALRPLAAANDKALAREVDVALQTAVNTIESFRTSRGLRTYDELGAPDRAAIANAVDEVRLKLSSVTVS